MYSKSEIHSSSIPPIIDRGEHDPSTVVPPHGTTTHSSTTGRSLHNGSPPLTASSFKNSQQMAEEVLGEITWDDDCTGHLPCPGKDKHTSRDAHRDCRVMLDGVPTVSCFHGSCGEEIKSANARACY